MLNVILRTCDSVEVASPLNSRSRDFGTKKEVIRICADSVRKSIDYFENTTHENVNFIILDDFSSEETIDFLKLLKPGELIHQETPGNGASFAACIDKARSLEGLMLFIEDDYLLEESCLYEMVALYEQFEKNNQVICVYPSDYPDRYRNPEPCFVVLGERRHWRTVVHTTCTFMLDKATLTTYYAQLAGFRDYGKDPALNEETSVNLIYKEVLCFSPIPSLAEHYQYNETLSPFCALGKNRRMN
jgi:glycosyltransferase involved in cell wall biosynthesis